jgi:DNA-binding Xre family transcriptional regulator
MLPADMGKLKLKIKEVSESKGVDNPFVLSQKSGLDYAITHKLWKGNQTRIDLATLEKLCDALKVPPGRLFDYERG